MNVVEDIRVESIKMHHFKGVDLAAKILDNIKSPVLVYFDPDIDGGFAGLFVCKFLTMTGKRFNWYCNTRREHGWQLDSKRVAGKDIIAVDFQITDNEVKEICDWGCNLISIDHHQNGEKLIEYVSDEGKMGVVINNQYPFEEEDGRYLSGAGVVFEVFSELDARFNSLINRSIVGITLLSDIRDIENPNARGYLYDLYHHGYKGYIKYLIDAVMGEKDYGFGVPRMDRNFVDYRFSPKLNACFRFNEENEVIQFLMGSGVLDLECHKEQKQLLSEIKSTAEVRELPGLRVVSFYVKDFLKYRNVLSSFVGLTASQYLRGDKSCICMSIGNGYVERASFRGRINGLNYLGVMPEGISGAGHGSAFGIKGVTPSGKLFKDVGARCISLEQEVNWSPNVVRTANLSIFSKRKAIKYAIENQYCLSQNRVYVKYTGHSIVKKRGTEDWAEYQVDGMSVMCFEKGLDFQSGYIFPILERGSLAFYLESIGE